MTMAHDILTWGRAAILASAFLSASGAQAVGAASAPLAASAAAPASAPIAAQAPAPAPAPLPPGPRPVLCAYVDATTDTTPEPAPAPGAAPCPEHRTPQVLRADGDDLVVVLGAADASAKPVGAPWRLRLDGVSMGDDAQARVISRGAFVELRFLVRQDVASAPFWEAVYRHAGFHGAWGPLDIEVGWDADPVRFSLQPRGDDSVALTGRARVAAAVVVALLILGWFAGALTGTDWFRNGPTLPTGQRQSYSLARVQWGAWFVFTATAAAFLWVVRGVLPPLTDTVLALTTISAVTATASFMVDARSPLTPKPSQGLLADILSGDDDVAHLHRFQAVAVNGILLMVAVAGVVKHLTFPVFDDAWLAFLGVSNLAHAAGKGLLETKSP